ncbi:MAG: alanine racemase [Silvanigrellales bacterium]|nr:alanine racemase [Silvanigrellales bacterium]
MAPLNSSWLEISQGALERNVATFRGLLAQNACRLGGVLKGNAYGHGFKAVLPVLHPLLDVLYVIEPEDALAVRAFEASTHAPRKEVLVIGATEPDEAVALARAGVTLCVGDDGWRKNVEALRAARLPQPAKAHVHIDTGLSREGYAPGDIRRGFAFLADASDVLEVVGVFSHFANTEDVTEQEYALFQLENFRQGTDELRVLLGTTNVLEQHLAASAAALVLPQARLSVVRAGISLYGLWPSTETRLSARLTLPVVPTLSPALSWRCRSQIVKTLSPGSFVGYGCTWRCDVPTRIALLPVGYYDGLPRLVSGKAHVIVKGCRAPVLGRVMMNHIIVDVTRATHDDSPVVATLVGTDGTETLGVDTLSDWAQTINYEFVTRLGPHLKRTLTD